MTPESLSDTDLVGTGGLVHHFLLTLLVSLSFVSCLTVVTLLIDRGDIVTQGQGPHRLKHSRDDRPTYRPTATWGSHGGAQEGLLWGLELLLLLGKCSPQVGLHLFNKILKYEHVLVALIPIACILYDFLFHRFTIRWSSIFLKIHVCYHKCKYSYIDKLKCDPTFLTECFLNKTVIYT